MHSCPDAPSSRTHTDTNMPSDMDTKADWGIHRYADAQRRSHMQHSLVYRCRHTHRDRHGSSWSKTQVICPSHPSLR